MKERKKNNDNLDNQMTVKLARPNMVNPFANLANPGLTLGSRPAGVRVNYSDLQDIKRTGRLPLMGNTLPYVPALMTATGSQGYISANIVAKLPYQSEKSINSIEYNNIDSLLSVPSASFSVAKKNIYHYYKGLHNLSEVLDSATGKVQGMSTETTISVFFKDDMKNLRDTFLDTLGTTFEINDMWIKYNDNWLLEDFNSEANHTDEANKSEKAFNYLLFIHDLILLKAINLHQEYTRFNTTIQYLSVLNEKNNNFLNIIDGPLFKSSTYLSTVDSFMTQLAKFYLPLEYHGMFLRPLNTIGKKTTGSTTPLESTLCRLAFRETHFLDIYNSDGDSAGNTILISADELKAIWKSLRDIEDMLSTESIFTYINTYTNENVLQLRNTLMNKWQQASTKMRLFYDLMLPLITALSRAVGSGIIKRYQFSATYSGSVKVLTEYLNANLNTNNSSLLRPLNYVQSLSTIPQSNGILVKGNLIPELTFKPMVCSSDILYYKGEEGIFGPLYDLKASIELYHVNYSGKATISLVNEGKPDEHWALTLKDGDNTIPYDPRHFNLSIISDSIQSEFEYDMKVQDGKSVKSYKTSNSRLNTIEYTVTSIAGGIQKFFRNYSTRE